MKRLLIISITLLLTLNLSAQQEVNNDSIQIRKIYTEALTKGRSYPWLHYLTKRVGHRLAGSEGDKNAVEWAKTELDKLGLTKVWLQPVTVPHWVRGDKEEAHIETAFGNFNVDILALGGSVATPKDGLLAEVIEVKSIKEVEELGEKVKGKIVFYNRAMAADKIETMSAYGQAVDQRVNGAAVAGRYGAVGAIVRSMTTKMDNVPHTGTMRYGDIDENQKIPTAAISTSGAEMLSKLLEQNDKTKLKFYFKQNCENLPETQSFNVIGEIEGLAFPEEVIVVGGHLDSWDVGEGAHDDGAGVVQSMEVLRIFKELKIKPQRTVRVVLFANEEFGLSGGKTYAAEAEKKREKHIVALESDSGGFSPRGFGFTSNDKNYEQILQWKSLFEPYNLHIFARGGGGADIGPLKKDNNVIIGLRPDSQRYFDYHHAKTDILETVNKRELELGAASMASLIYLFDRYGVVK